MRCTRFLLAAASLAVLAMTSLNASAQTPAYDGAYGAQWSWIGSATGSTNSADNAGEVYASPDGSAWFTEGHQGKGGGTSIWGDAKSGAHWDSGYGHFNGAGKVLFSESMPNVGDVTGVNQTYIRANSGMQGTSFIAGGSGNDNAFFDNQVPAQTAGSAPQIHRTAADGTQDLKKNIQTLVTVRQEGMAFSQSSDVAWYAGGYQGVGSDVVNVGDGSITAATLGYSPYIGRYDASTETYVGPTKQGNADGRTHYNDLSVDETNNRVWGSGYALAQGGVNTFVDVDGDGTADINYALSTNVAHGFLAKFNATTMAYEDSLGWWSAEGNDHIRDNTATSDGGVVAVGRTNGNLKIGANNPTLGNEDIYVAKYDGSMNLVWDWQAETSGRDVGYSVQEDTDGNIYVGFAGFGTDINGNDDAGVMKFDSAGNLIWTNTIDNDGSQDEFPSGSASVYDKSRIYISAEHDSTAGGTAWNNLNPNDATIDYDNDMSMLQKLIPGDFVGTDGYVNSLDIDAAMAAVVVAGPIAGANVYDFDEDSDGDLADVIHWVQNSFDTDQGDTDLDGDIDNGDIGAVAGNFNGSTGTGKLWATGDTDGDGDVDNADIGVTAGNFTGTLAGNLVPSPNIADLIYDPATGELSLDASDAAGGIITSFQLESVGQFLDGNYVSLPPAFGGFFEDVSANTLADSDLSFVGFSGVESIGNVLAPGLDLVSLEALLTTALYSGSLGSGQFEFDLVLATAIPEPGTGALLALGLGAIGFRRRRRQVA